MEPLISVIVPVYKVEAYLARCLDSIVNQTYRNLEIILVDDGSPDNCGTICDDYARRDGRIWVIHQKNAGVAAARNVGLDVMTGEYLMFVDSDDWISLDAVQAMYDRLIQDGSDLVLGRHVQTYDENGMTEAFDRWVADGCYSREALFAKMGEYYYFPGYAYGKFYKSECFLNVRFPAVSYSEDLATLPNVLNRCDRISVSERVVYFYYQRTDSLAHTKNDKSRQDCLKAYLNMTMYCQKNGYTSALDYWFSSSIHRAFECEDKQTAVGLIGNCFQKQEIRQLLVRQNWKVNLKWLALNYPWVNDCIRIAKKMISQ